MPNNKEIAQALLGFPSNEDAQFAKKQDWSYGQPYAPYFEGKRFTHLTDDPNEAFKKANNLATANTPVKMQSMQIPNNMRGMSEDFDDYYAKGALAANRSALATLGFDPSKTAVDMGTPLEKAQVYGFHSPNSDTIYTNYKRPSNIVHESIHRGIKKLRDSPFWQKIGASNNELVIRRLMQTKMGDPEVGSPERNAAVSYFGDKNYPYRQKMIDDMEAAAALLIAKQRPRGPR